MSLSEILNLSVEEKIMLVEQIWESIDHTEIEQTDAQNDELDHRIALDNKGEMPWVSMDELKNHLQSKRR